MSSDAQRSLGGPILTLGTTLCLLGAGYFMHSDLRASSDELDEHLEQLTERMAAVERAVQLYRFEQQTKLGLGFPALLEQLRHWAPQMGLSTTPAAQLPVIEERLRAVVSAMASLGPDVFPELTRRFEQAKPGTDDELQMWLAAAMLEVDRDAARDFLQTVLQGMAFKVSPRMRLFAADELTKIDPAVASALLRSVLLTESHNGLDLQRVDPSLLAAHPDAAANIVPYRGFATFVQRYVATQDEDAEQILTMTLGRRHHHDFLTLQECVKALGSLRSKEAADPIVELFENPPRGATPMFRNYCLDALASIQGAGACEYFQAALLREQLEMVRGKLTELIKTYCGN